MGNLYKIIHYTVIFVPKTRHPIFKMQEIIARNQITLISMLEPSRHSRLIISRLKIRKEIIKIPARKSLCTNTYT